MITAGFTYQENSRSLRGTVTLKNDGKVSVSLFDGKYFSLNTRYKAKKLANDIVEANFVHKAVTYLNKEDISLTDFLKEKTSDLKEKYIQSVKDWAKNAYKRVEEKSIWTIEQWYKQYEVQYSVVDNKIVLDFSKSNTKKYHEFRSDYLENKEILKSGFDIFEAKKVNHANNHYENSIVKLSDRLVKKGVGDPSKIQIIKGWVGVNLNMTIQYENITVKAWTIVAEGLIQIPHYRYLIK